jgi:O-antigen/teichoic acid export membrane protein
MYFIKKVKSLKISKIVYLNMSLTRKILSNTFWQVLGRVVTALIGIISIKIITNYLPTDVYGQYTTIYEFIGFFAIAADFGLYTIGVREMAKKEKLESEILANVLAIRLCLIAFTLLAAVVTANLIPQYSGTFVSSGIWIVAFTTGLALLSGTLTSVLQYRLKMQYANIGIILSRFVSIGYVAYTVFILKPDNLAVGFQNLLYAGLFANLLLVMITFYFVSKETKIYLDFNWQYTRELVSKSLPYGLALILSTIYFKIDIILLSLLKDYHQVGIYGVPLKLMEILSVLPVFLLNSALPAMTESFNNNKAKFVATLSKLWTFLMMLAAPILIGGLVLAFPLTFVISNPQFLSGYHCNNNIQVVFQNENEAALKCKNEKVSNLFEWPNAEPDSFTYLFGSDMALKIILFGMFFSFLNTLFAFSLVSMDHQSKLIITNAIGVIFNLVTNLIFIPKYGFLGAAVTTVLSEIIILYGTYYYVRKNVPLQLPYKKSIYILFSAAVMGLIVFLLQPITYNYVQNLNILLLIPMGALVYGVLIYTLKVVTNEDLKKLLRRG